MRKGNIIFICVAIFMIAALITWIIHCKKNGLLVDQNANDAPSIQVTETEEAPEDPDACVANFEESAKETLSAYEGFQYSVNKWTVTIVIDLDKWNATPESDRTAFMNEIYTLLSVDAKTSGILSDHAVSVSFMTSDYKNTKVYKIEKD